MEPEAPPAVPPSQGDEDGDSRIVREYRETLSGELLALVEEQGQVGALSPPEDGEGGPPAGES